MFLYGMSPRPLRKNKKGNIMKEKKEKHDLRAPSEFKFAVFTAYIDDNDWDDDVMEDSAEDDDCFVTEYDVLFTGSNN